jgi:hypothetical protein
MNVLTITGRKRESYKVELEYSLLWECALGIAAITNTPILDTLEKKSAFETFRHKMPDELIIELNYVEVNNTWKSLLQLLHAFEKNSNDIEEFKGYVNNLSNVELRYTCLPYLGTDFQERRILAANDDKNAVDLMKQVAQENPFLPAYIDFISQVNVVDFKKHLLNVMSLWIETVFHADADSLLTILERDFIEKSSMKEKLTPEEFVAWATNGTDYAPEPNVQRVLLIPQLTYRPWTIVSDIEETKVFYYPIPNTSIDPTDKYLPNYFLIQKYKALGDEVRLRMIKLLSEHDCTLKELTEQLELGKSTVHHHLKILRAASLVGQKASSYYLKEKSVAYLPKELELYLNQE